MIGAGISLNDLWAFDFSTNLWELLSEGKELPSPLHYPHPASDRGIVYDQLKDRLLLFQCSPSMEAQLTEGNQPLPLDDSSAQPEYEVQVFTFNLEEKYWTQLNPPLKPPDRLEWFRTVWDPKNDRVFLFGGRLIIQGPKPSEVQEVQAKDLWVFDCKEEHWQELANNITLPGIYPIDLGPSSYDPKEDRLLVLKPKANDGDLCDISALRLSGSSWMDLKSSNPPVFRVQKYVAYDPFFHVLILPVRGESETVGEIKEEIWIYNLARNSWSYCRDLPGNDWNHLIVSGKPGEVYILTTDAEYPSSHNLWHLTLGP